PDPTELPPTATPRVMSSVTPFPAFPAIVFACTCVRLTVSATSMPSRLFDPMVFPTTEFPPDDRIVTPAPWLLTIRFRNGAEDPPIMVFDVPLPRKIPPRLLPRAIVS